MKILLVDDSRTIAAVFAARLGAFGHEVFLAENGAIAVDKFQQLAPDLVLMDIEMPVLDGFQATSRIRQFEQSQQWAWTPIIFLTSVDTPGNFVTSVDAGGDDLIPKNIPEEVLRAKIKAMVRVAELRREVIAANRQMQSDIRAREAAEAELSRRCVELTELNSTLSKMQIQLVQTEKLASIGQLAAGVAHEINTPIGFLRSNLGTLDRYLRALCAALDAVDLGGEAGAREALRRRFDLDYIEEDAPTLIRESVDGVDRVARIVQNLKDFSQLDNAGEWQRVDLRDGLEATLNLLAGEARERIEFVREFGAMPKVECMVNQINQVFVNLLTNAMQAIDKTPGRIVVRTGGDARNAWIEITDNGVGIDEGLRAKIFDPFFTTRPVGQGAGLGLSLSYGILQSHNGSIEVTSEVGSGSCFRVCLPVARDGRRPGSGGAA